MKFDPFVWKEENTNEEIEVGEGWLRLRCSAPAALYVTAQGFEALVGYAPSFDLQLSEELTFRVEGPDGLRVFRHVAVLTSVRPEGEVFTNIDRMPNESGNVSEVTRAMRMFELQRRAALREIRAERDALVAVKSKQAEVVEDTGADEQADGQEAEQ